MDQKVSSTSYHSPARRHARRSRGRGQSLVEFALALPVFCALLFGSIEMGMLYKSHAAYQEAAQEAVRVGSAVGASDQDTLDELKIILAAENLKNIQSVTIYDATVSGCFAVPIRTTAPFDNAHTTYVYSTTAPAAGGGSGAFICSVAGTPPPCTGEVTTQVQAARL